MISRSTLFALAFACFATFSLAVAASADDARPAVQRAPQVMQFYQLPRVVVSGRIVGTAATETAAATKP